jgi:hypothetical protein
MHVGRKREAYLVGATETRDLFLLNGKVIIVSDFFARFDVGLGVNDDLIGRQVRKAKCWLP